MLNSKLSEKEAAAEILEEIADLAKKIDRPIRFMEVCGTHTVAIFRSGIRQMLPANVALVSGPGCPVCVTPDEYMDKAIEYAKREDIIIATFGDMLKVPGSVSSLNEVKAKGADVRIVYSPLDSLKIAADNPHKKVIFLAVGFETTSPTAAATVLAAKEQGIKNFFALSAQKLVPPAIEMLIRDPVVKTDGFILPGHVAVVTGTKAFDFIAEAYHIGGVVAGFEPLSILRAVCRLLMQMSEGAAKIENEYKSVVSVDGNETSRRITDKVYDKATTVWRGIGAIPDSGLVMREEYAEFDIERVLPLELQSSGKRTACRCGEVLQGIVTPPQCPLFTKGCTPLHAVGPCMASVEGICAAWYKYGRDTFSFV